MEQGLRGLVDDSSSSKAALWEGPTLGRSRTTSTPGCTGWSANRFAKFLNGLWSRMAASGRAPTQMHTLELRGRRTGRAISLPVVVADYEGERYLVAMLGQGVNWVVNARAAASGAVLRRGGRETVRLEEVEDPELRGSVLRRYLQLAPGARAHIAVDSSASLEELESVATRHPIFRIRSDSPSGGDWRGGSARVPSGRIGRKLAVGPLPRHNLANPWRSHPLHPWRGGRPSTR